MYTFSGAFDPYKYTNQDMCRIHGVVYETLMEDEENQVKGFVHYADGAGVSFPHLTLFTPREAVRIVKNGEVIITFHCIHKTFDRQLIDFFYREQFR